MASNLYQNLRTGELRVSFFSGDLFLNEVSEKGISTMLLDFDSTASNIKLRQSPLSLNIEIISSQLDRNYSPTYGSVFIQVLENSLPKIIYPYKNNIGEDAMISKNSGIVGSDLPTNMYAMLILDFGFFAVFIYAFIIILVLLLFHFLLKNTVKNNVFFLYLYILSTITFFQLENGLGHTILMMRNAILLTMLFKFIMSLKFLFLKK
jgi:hypothetical protein